MTDNIYLRNVHLPLPLYIGLDAWSRPKPQPVTISMRVAYPRALIANAAETDTVNQTLNYGELYRAILETVEAHGFGKPPVVGTHELSKLCRHIVAAGFGVVEDTLTEYDFSLWKSVREAEVWIHVPKAILRATQGLKYRAISRGEPEQLVEEEILVEGVQCYCIIGINSHERLEKQAVLLSLRFRQDISGSGDTSLAYFQGLTRQIAETADESSFQTVEALATSVARIATKEYGMKEATVKVEKPSAQAYVEYSGVEITRDAGFFT